MSEYLIVPVAKRHEQLAISKFFACGHFAFCWWDARNLSSLLCRWPGPRQRTQSSAESMAKRKIAPDRSVRRRIVGGNFRGTAAKSIASMFACVCPRYAVSIARMARFYACRQVRSRRTGHSPPRSHQPQAPRAVGANPIAFITPCPA